MFTEEFTTPQEIEEEFSTWKNCYTGTFHRIQKRTKAEAKRALIVFSDLALFHDYRDIKPALRRHFINLFMESGTDCTLNKKQLKEAEKESKEIVKYYTGFICDE